MSDLDEQLAQATDQLLDGGTMRPLDGENRELGTVVQGLYDLIDPAQRPSAEFQTKLVARLNRELDQQAAPPTLRLLDRPLMRLAALAAAVVLVLVAVVLLAVPDTATSLQGTAIGLNDGAALLILVAVAAGGAFFYWRSRR